MVNEYKISNQLTSEEIDLIKELERKLENKVILIAYDKLNENT